MKKQADTAIHYTPLTFLRGERGGGIKLTYSRLEQRDEIQTRQTDRQTE